MGRVSPHELKLFSAKRKWGYVGPKSPEPVLWPWILPQFSWILLSFSEVSETAFCEELERLALFSTSKSGPKT